MKNSFKFLDGEAEGAAKRLLGSILERKIGKKIIKVKIVETECYNQHDEASHAFRGETRRNRVMFGPSGHSYVYFTYGMHHCVNIVVGKLGFGSAVLIRAVEPLEGEKVMIQNRGGITGKSLSNGPGKVCKALGIDLSLNGHNLASGDLRLHIKAPIKQSKIVQTTRIGISKNKETPWRFYIKDNEYISKK